MPNINDSFPSNYLKASDLQGREVVVTIDHVAFELVGRQKEKKAVLYFKGKAKGVILNKTNANQIMQISGSALTEEWEGVQIKLFPTETEFAGETVECIRIKGAAARQQMSRMTPAPPTPAPTRHQPEHDDDHSAPMTDDDIPF